MKTSKAVAARKQPRRLLRSFSENGGVKAVQKKSKSVQRRHSEAQADRMPYYGMDTGTLSSSSSGLYRSQSMMSLTGDRAVLGQSFKSSYALRNHRTAVLKELGLNTKSLSRIPKHPRPKRTLEIFLTVIKGLREHIRITTLDYEQAEQDSRVKTTGSHAQRVKNIERHRKKLEYLLSKIEELEDHYQVQHQMREGTKTLSKAYEQSEGQHKRSSMSNVHYGFKECTKTMCAIEAQLESMMGQFHCEMKGIVGFARVMPGDSFEVSIRHGNQKWKTKGTVSKTSEQHWDIDMKTFNVQLNNSLAVKVFESKRLSKSSLGEKHCDILGLFAANPQILTVNVNDIGTIKINLLVQWLPLANFSEKLQYYDPPPREAPAIRPISMTMCYDSLPIPKPAKQLSPRPDLLCDMNEEKAGVRHLADAIEEEEEEGEVYSWPANLEGAIQRLREALEDYQEHSSTLKSLYDLVTELDSILGNTERNSGLSSDRNEARRGSSISLAIETAFDFLNCESDDDDEEIASRKDVQTLSPMSTARSQADSGIESLLATKVSYTTGNEELDQVILQHCVQCEVQLEALDNVGMLKSKEKRALASLKHQTRIFKKLVPLGQKLTSHTSTAVSVHQVLREMSGHNTHVTPFWIAHSSSLYMTIPEFSQALYRTYNDQIKEQYDIKPERVFNSILRNITNGSAFSTENQRLLVVTAHQLVSALLESKCPSMDYFVQEAASEMWLLGQLKSGTTSVVLRSIESLSGALPTSQLTRALTQLLSSSNAEVSAATESYIGDLAEDKLTREAFLAHLLSCLEDAKTEVRVGACLGLSKIKAVEVSDLLVYVAQADSSRRVQAAARRTLASFNAVLKRSSSTTK